MKKFVHRDVRADNVLVNADEQVKIADFGLARDEEYTASETSKYPVRWASPEVLSMRLFSSKADVWSFGVMITEVMTYGMKPYPSMNIEKVRISEAGLRGRNAWTKSVRGDLIRGDPKIKYFA